MVNVAVDGGGSIGKAMGGGGMIAMAAPAIAGAPVPSSGGYKFSREEIDSVIQQWEDLKSALMTDRTNAENMAHVTAPGAEFASQDFTTYANPSGKAFLKATQKMIEYVDKYITALKNARDGISTQEEHAQEDVNRVGSGVMEV